MNATQRKSSTECREKILLTASTLFYERGINNVGIDLIIKEAGVAKMTFYNHFPSKDDLVKEWVSCQRSGICDWLDLCNCGSNKKPKEKLKVLFPSLKKWFEDPSFRGCSMVNTLAEISDPEHPALEVIKKRKEMIKGCIESLCKEAEVVDHRETAAQILLLIEGAISRALVTGDSSSADIAAKIAKSIIKFN